MTKFRIVLISMLLSSFFMACSSADETESTTGIPESPIVLKVATKPYAITKVVCRKLTLFTKPGYDFFILNKDLDCTSTDYTFTVNAGAHFFIETESLKVGTYSAQGPFMGSTSYFGCDVEILQISGSSIVGKVSGGNKTNNEYVEGKFTATFCN